MMRFKAALVLLIVVPVIFFAENVLKNQTLIVPSNHVQPHIDGALLQYSTDLSSGEMYLRTHKDTVPKDGSQLHAIITKPRPIIEYLHPKQSQQDSTDSLGSNSAATNTPGKLLTAHSDEVLTHESSLSPSRSSLQPNTEDSRDLPAEASLTETNSSPCPSEVEVIPKDKLKVWETFRHTLEEYKLFHAEQSSRLRSGNNGSSVRILTWACVDPVRCSGVGDQFYRIQQALLLAIISKRVLCLYWNDEDLRTMKYLIPHEINWRCGGGVRKGNGINFKLDGRQNFARLLSMLDGSSEYVTLTHELAVPFIRAYYKMSVDPTIASRLNKIGFRNLLPKSSKLPMTFINGKLLRYLFTFPAEVIATVDSIQESLGISTQPYLAVHMRTGFFGTAQQEVGHFNSHKIFRDKQDWLSSLLCATKLATHELGSIAPVYLATDSYLVKNLAETQFSPQVKIANLTLQHVALTRKNNGGSSESSESETMDGFMATWVDFLLLARSHVLVRSISGFSTIAGQFCSIPKQFCAPHCSARC